MHDCRKFREDWVAASRESRDVSPACEDCRRFCSESAAVFAALDAPNIAVPENSDEYWSAFEERCRKYLNEEGAARASRLSYLKWAGGIAAAAVFVIAVTWGTYRTLPEGGASAYVELVDDHIEGLDPDVVTYLGQSELFLRSFTKIEPSDSEDLADARFRARRKLAGITIQKTAAGHFAPVVIALDEYESVLRDIKNLRSPEEVADIQRRIERNGLIANLKAYQPRVVLTSQP